MNHLAVPTTAALLMLTIPALAADITYQTFLQEQAAVWMADPVVQSALTQANAAHASLTEDSILKLDTDWRAQLGTADTPLIEAILTHAASDYLRELIAQSQGTIVEVIIMDQRGMNVAISAVTSDYWQGDEDKFQMTYPLGPDAIHASDIELDESTGTYVVQVSAPILDSGRRPVGAVTFSLDAELL